jgi:uncharacterized protein (DUF1501 family)
VHACGIEDDTRSHFEAQDLMEHGGVTAGGWLGRFLRVRPAPSSGALACVAVGRALAGMPAWGTVGDRDAGARGFFAFGEDAGVAVAARVLYAMESGQLGVACARHVSMPSRALKRCAARKYQPANGADYGDDDFSKGLSQLAQLIKANVGLEAASIDLDGWDSHFTQETALGGLIQRLARGLAAFRADLGSRMATTTVVVMTEFGRTIEENSAFGTDHGRGRRCLSSAAACRAAGCTAHGEVSHRIITKNAGCSMAMAICQC